MELASELKKYVHVWLNVYSNMVVKVE